MRLRSRTRSYSALAASRAASSAATSACKLCTRRVLPLSPPNTCAGAHQNGILHLIHADTAIYHAELRAQLQATTAYVLQGCLKPLEPCHTMNHLSNCASSHLICCADHLMCMMLISIEIEDSDLAPFGMGVRLFKYSFPYQTSLNAILTKRAVPHERPKPLDTAWSDGPLQDY